MTTEQLQQRHDEYPGLAVQDVQCYEVQRRDRETVLRGRLASGDTLAAFYLLDTREALERVSSALERWKRRHDFRSFGQFCTPDWSFMRAKKDLAACRRIASRDPLRLQIVTAYMNKNMNAAQQLL